MSSKSKKPTTPETPVKEVSPLDKFLKDSEESGDAALLPQLLDAKGDITADYSMPEEFETEVMAGQMVDHLIAFKQSKQNWIAAKQVGDHAKRKQLFEQMRFNQVTVAIIQYEFPDAKNIADEIMRYRVKDVQGKRQKFLQQADDAED